MPILDDLQKASRAGKVELDPFVYVADFPIAVFLGAATVPVGVAINNDSDFLLAKTMLVSYTAVGVLLPNPDYNIGFADSGSGRQLQDNLVHVHNIMGSAEHPYIWPEPKLIKAGGVFTITLQNLTAVAAEVSVALSGFKVFYLRDFNRAKLGLVS